MIKKKHSTPRKANRKGSRDAELENKTGWVRSIVIYKNKKKYNRKDGR
jgi:hypothetical protein